MQRILLLTLVLQLVLGAQVGARQFYQLGGASGISWSSVGALSFVDTVNVPGGIQPLETELSHNLITSMPQRNGDLTSLISIYTLPINWLDDRSLIIDSDPNTAFVHPPRINFFRGPGFFYTTQMFFDLGAPFPIERVRFSTRADFPGNKIRQYRLYLNDGAPESRDKKGDIIWNLVHNEKDNLNSVVELDLEPQVVRHLYLHPLEVGETWEVAEFEVYGQGFVPKASFLAAPIDLGQASNLGRIWWSGRLDPGAKILLQSRSGRDAQPEVYWRKTGVGDEEVPFGTNGQPMTESQYTALPLNLRGQITQDLENWSVWQTYQFNSGLEGTQILSPSPNQYLQLRIDFFSEGLQGGQIDSLFFEYSESPLVKTAIGEVFPVFVDPSEPVQFTYAVRTLLESDQGGFNALEVRSPAQFESVQAVRIDRETVEFTQRFDPADPHSFSVEFPRIVQDQTLLEVDFEARVFMYGTTFSGLVSDMDIDEVAQQIVPGDAVAELPSNGLSVRTSLQSDLLLAPSAAPNPFSPNGDGINDQVDISFTLLSITDAVPLKTEVYDLAGTLVHQLHSERGSSAAYSVSWDGRNDRGEMVPPGMYVYRISVEADGGMEVKMGHIALVY